jgi:GTP cyclohydrolase II
MTTNPRRLVGLSGYGLDVTEMVTLGGDGLSGRWPLS